MDGPGHIHDILDCTLGLERSFHKDFRQVRSWDIVHREVVMAVALTAMIDRHNTRVR